MKVRLSEILDTFDEMSETTSHYLDLETGEIVCIDRMLMEPSEIQELYEQLDEHDCCQLPGERDLREYDTMEAFVDTLERKAHRQLAAAISGRGAFRRFKEGIRELGIEDAWYSYLEKSRRQKAIDWCEENDLEWEE